MSSESTVGKRWSVRETTGGLPLTVSRAALIVLTVGFAAGQLVGVQIPLRTQAGVYLFGMVAMNLPHGGYEHFENLRRRAASFQGWYVGVYLLAVGLFAGLFFLAPIAGLALAVSTAVAKGGFGDLHVLEAVYGTEHLRSRTQRVIAAAVRGGAVMVVPMVFWPETFLAFSSVMVNIFEPGALAGVAGDLQARRLMLGGGYGALLLAHLGLGYARATGSGSFLADAAETLLLVAYFAAVPVVIAVGLYFPLWYSARQVARTRAVDDTVIAPDENSGLLDALESDDPKEVTLASWGVLIAGSVATFGLAAALWTVSPQPLGGAGVLIGLVAFWSIFISIVALPHVVVGQWLDGDRGIWYVP
ncbi:Brp/Blh family beta-carotene 15,15'-dioxygenase [Halobaculum rubrum]|uniref:Brp/Blh family beta-carotene 15,15'-dioxygenase n=1 Tax=Halobaculum rubrum TaxID=2872158 RepID=UPI001CA3D983|nr:Brp/Blh family beta-carotene 15,15'-dioxygenase [Halobaculum rubrum]QZX99107.1 Brp/Blh family beta-carotene 15,15'-dioxygenase [Halobaculum rubrum]